MGLATIFLKEKLDMRIIFLAYLQLIADANELDFKIGEISTTVVATKMLSAEEIEEFVS